MKEQGGTEHRGRAKRVWRCQRVREVLKVRDI